MLHAPETVRPETKARELLCEILPKKALQEFLENDFFHYEGKIGLYRISRESQTEVYRYGRLAATSCMQLSIFAPSYDRMVAEYLILSNDEHLYWNKANVFPVRPRLDFRVVAVGLLDFALLLKLVLSYVL